METRVNVLDHVQNELVALLAGRRGHFEMESGYHSPVWYDLDRLFLQPTVLSPFATELARELAKYKLEGICGPEVGGARLAEEVASWLGVEAFITERREIPEATGLFPVRYEVPGSQRARLKNRRMAIVDDAISAGSAVRGTLADLRCCGAKPVVMGALFIFGDAAARLAGENGLGLEGVARVPADLWKPSECPLCRAGVPFEKVSDANPPKT